MEKFDMDKYDINNSLANRVKQTKATPNPPEEKKIQKVVNGPVTVKKKSGFRKFTETFVAEDLPKVKHFVITDVIVPSVKKAISDIVKNGIDIFMYGDINPNRNSNIPGTRVSYKSYGSNYNNNRYEEPRNTISRNVFDYEQLEFSTKGDAELILGQMIECIERYGLVTVAELFDAAGKSTTNHCANNYGWTDLSEASTYRTRDGYALKLPKASPIK